MSPFDKFIGLMYYQHCDEISALATSENRILEIRHEGDVIVDVEPNRVNVWLNDLDGNISQITYN